MPPSIRAMHVNEHFMLPVGITVVLSRIYAVVLAINSIAFGKSTSQRIYSEQHVPKIGWKLHKYGLKHALHTLDGHFRWSQYQKNQF